MKSPEPVEPVTALIVLTTLGSEEEARALVRSLIDERIIACGTLLGGGRSLYRWEGEIREEHEVVVLLKTDSSKWTDLAARVRQRHPYDVPELLAIPVQRGLEAYLAWLAAEIGA